MRNSLIISVFFHAILIFAFATVSMPAYFLLGIITVYAMIINRNVIYQLEPIEIPIALMYFGIVLLMTIINFFGQPVVAFHLFIATIGMATAILFTRDAKVYYYSSKITFIGFQIIVLLYAARTGLDGFPAVVPLENMINGVSANGITSFAVLLQVNFSIVRFLLFRKMAILTSLLTLLIAMLGYGRGSIIAAFLILLLSLFTYFALKSRIKFLLYITGVSFAIIFTIGYYFDDIYIFLEANTKLSAGIVDTSRSKIISEYLSQINPLTFFTGADYTYTSVISEFNGNPHNSFIRAHHIFGLPYLLFLVIFPFYCIAQKTKVIEWFFYGFALIILYFRAFSEPIIGPTLFDFYFFSMFLMIAKTKGLLIDKA